MALVLILLVFRMGCVLSLSNICVSMFGVGVKSAELMPSSDCVSILYIWYVMFIFWTCCCMVCISASFVLTLKRTGPGPSHTGRSRTGPEVHSGPVLDLP